MKNITRDAIDRLNLDLSLPYNSWMQDWDIELADLNRVEEFCDYYENADLNSDEKFALMKLIIASSDAYFCQKGYSGKFWDKISKLLEKDWPLHLDTIQYWACLDCDENDVFAITPLMRSLLH